MVTLKGNNGTYEGTSEDNKPLNVPVNTEFNELDTGKKYYFDGEAWQEEPSCEGGGFTPTSAQLAAMNSGITEEDVAQIGVNENNISTLTNEVDGVQLEFRNNAYIALGNVGDTISLTPTVNGGWQYILIENPIIGNVYKITATGGSTPRAWGCVDTDLKIISVATAGTAVTDFLLKIPANTKYLIINANKDITHSAAIASILDRLNASTF